MNRSLKRVQEKIEYRECNYCTFELQERGSKKTENLNALINISNQNANERTRFVPTISLLF